MKIFLIRHGQTTGDIEDRYGGHYDDHLSEKGQHQAQELAKNLIGKGIEIIFCSSLIRARETAQYVANELNIEIKVISNIKEQNRYGILTGMIKSDAKEKYPNQVDLLSDRTKTVKEAESYEDFKTRILNAFKEIVSSSHRTIAIISHGGPLKCILREIFNQEIERDIEDCEFIELEYKKS